MSLTPIPPGFLVTRCPPRKAGGLTASKVRAKGGTRVPAPSRAVLAEREQYDRIVREVAANAKRVAVLRRKAAAVAV